MVGERIILKWALDGLKILLKTLNLTFEVTESL